jgi:hypothetical protein
VLATAPAWWTFLDTLSIGRTVYDTPQALQNRPAWLIAFFDDLFFLELHPGRPVFAPATNFLILLGCLWAVTQMRRLALNRAALAIGLGLVASLAAAFSLVPASWFLQLPFLRNIHQVNVHFSCIALVHAGVLAGWGFSTARRAFVSERFKVYLATIAGLLAVMFALYFKDHPTLWTEGRGYEGWRKLLPYHAFVYANAVALTVALAWLTFAAARHARGGRLTYGVMAVSALAVFAILGRHGQHLDPGIPTDHFITVPGSRADLFVRSPAVEFLQRATATTPGRVMGTGDTLFPGFMSVYGLEGINGPDAIFSGPYRELLDASTLATSMGWRFSLLPHLSASAQPLLDFLNVSHVASPLGLSLNHPSYRSVATLDLEIHESNSVWPRAFFTPALESYETAAELVERLSEKPPGEPFAAVQRSDLRAPTSGTQSVRSGAVPAVEYELTNNDTSFTIHAPSAGFVVLQETWLPEDFRVTIDGNPTEYFRVNHAFKGVVVPTAGSHRITFSYWPRHFTVSLILCGVGLSGFTVLLLVIRRRHSPEPIEPVSEQPVPVAG